MATKEICRWGLQRSVSESLLREPQSHTTNTTTITPTTSQPHKLTTWQTDERSSTLLILQAVFQIQILQVPQVYHGFLRWHVPLIVVWPSKVGTARWLGCCLPGIPWSSGKARFSVFDLCPWNQHHVFQCNATWWCTRMMYLRSLSILTCGAYQNIRCTHHTSLTGGQSTTSHATFLHGCLSCLIRFLPFTFAHSHTVLFFPILYYSVAVCCAMLRSCWIANPAGCIRKLWAMSLWRIPSMGVRLRFSRALVSKRWGTKGRLIVTNVKYLSIIWILI